LEGILGLSAAVGALLVVFGHAHENCGRVLHSFGHRLQTGAVDTFYVDPDFVAAFFQMLLDLQAQVSTPFVVAYHQVLFSWLWLFLMSGFGRLFDGIQHFLIQPYDTLIRKILKALSYLQCDIGKHACSHHFGK